MSAPGYFCFPLAIVTDPNISPAPLIHLQVTNSKKKQINMHRRKLCEKDEI